MNIRFEYIYRDAANYKSWGDVVFENATCRKLGELESSLRQVLIDGEFFLAKSCGVPDLRFPDRVDELDHDWHTFHLLEYSEDEPNDALNRDISEFLKCFTKEVERI